MIKNTLCRFAVLSMLASGPSLAREVSEFPSRSIHTVIPNIQADPGFDLARPHVHAIPTINHKTPPTPNDSARPVSFLDACNPHILRDCQSANSVLALSQIPQLRALSQHRLQCLAP
jgi:hypothetical protein